jgi:hypothetical protein
MKDERSFKVVLKNVHPSINLEELKEDINNKGHIITNIWNVRQSIIKKPLPIFSIESKPTANNNIYIIIIIYIYII